MTKRCGPCGTSYRRIAVHLSTAQHRRAVQPKVVRRGRLSAAVREGGRPAWMAALSRDEEAPEGYIPSAAWIAAGGTK